MPSARLGELHSHLPHGSSLAPARRYPKAASLTIAFAPSADAHECVAASHRRDEAAARAIDREPSTDAEPSPGLFLRHRRSGVRRDKRDVAVGTGVGTEIGLHIEMVDLGNSVPVVLQESVQYVV